MRYVSSNDLASLLISFLLCFWSSFNFSIEFLSLNQTETSTDRPTNVIIITIENSTSAIKNIFVGTRVFAIYVMPDAKTKDRSNKKKHQTHTNDQNEWELLNWKKRKKRRWRINNSYLLTFKLILFNLNKTNEQTIHWP